MAVERGKSSSTHRIKRAGRAVRQAKYSLRVFWATFRAHPWVQATIVALIIRYHEVSDALAPYTAVDSDEVLQRIQASLMPWHTQAPATIARIHRRPDVKGPACSLLTVLLLSTLVHRGEGWSSDDHTHLGWMLLQLAHLAQGVAMLVLYVIVVSGAVWAWGSSISAHTARRHE